MKDNLRPTNSYSESPYPSAKLVCGLGGALAGISALPEAPVFGAVLGSLSGLAGGLRFENKGVKA